MKITGTSNYMDVDFGTKIARFNGELVTDGFFAYRSSMRWLSPYDNIAVTNSDIEAVITSVLEEARDKQVKIYFG